MIEKRAEGPNSSRLMLESLDRLCRTSSHEAQQSTDFGYHAMGIERSLTSAIESSVALVNDRAKDPKTAKLLVGVFSATMAKTRSVGKEYAHLWTLPVSELYFDGTCKVHIFVLWRNQGERKYHFEYDVTYNEKLIDKADMAHLYKHGVPFSALDEVLLARRIKR
ncbi:MAG TPA: hypothetical protein VMV00_02545 [Candidatus Baltobacteraceae bacterium]|nr:hypothetical protein [Candidatus Baltobacteraceae bacterium]